MNLTSLLPAFILLASATPASAQMSPDFQLGMVTERAILCDLHIDFDLVHIDLRKRGPLTEARKQDFGEGARVATVAWQVSSDTCKMAERRAHEVGIMAKWKR